MPVVEVFLDASGPFRFLLDTGSQTNHIDSALARKLGLRATARFSLYTPSGQTIVPGGRVGKVTLGSMEASDQEFLFTSFDDLSRSLPGIRGILGQEFLTHFDYTLDLQHHRLTVGDPPSTGLPISVQLIFGRMAVPTTLGTLLLDSGAEMLTLFRQSPRPSNAQLMGTSGLDAFVSVQAAPKVGIGDRCYRPARAVYRAVPASEAAGLLPANLFRAIFICNSKGYVVFDPQS